MIAIVLAILLLCSGGIKVGSPFTNYDGDNSDIEVWYINQAKRIDRKTCMVKQLDAMGIKQHRFQAIDLSKEDLWPNGKYHDCVKGGTLKENSYVDKTTGSLSTGQKTKMAIIGDTCSHKRLFQQLAESNSTAKYFLVLEDDAILHPTKLMSSLHEFIIDYQGPHKEDWQMVQLDFVGSSCTDHAVGMAGGKKVFKPRRIFTPGFNNNEKDAGLDCSRYYGSQALLMQKSQLLSVIENMESAKTNAMDHVQGQLPRALAWRPQIAGSPMRAFSEVPSFCQASSKSSISN